MTNEEALQILSVSLRKAKRWGELCEVDERSMQEIIAALSSPCACGGREPLLVVKAETFGTTLKFPRPLTELPPQGTPVRVIILADEEGAKE